MDGLRFKGLQPFCEGKLERHEDRIVAYPPEIVWREDGVEIARYPINLKFDAKPKVHWLKKR